MWGQFGFTSRVVRLLGDDCERRGSHCAALRCQAFEFIRSMSAQLSLDLAIDTIIDSCCQ